MSALRQAVEQYLTLRKQLGFKLHDTERALRSFSTFVESESASTITVDLALRWATRPAGAQPATWAWRYGTVRRLALWLSAGDTRVEVPPPGLLSGRYRRKRPYLYSDAEVEAIVRAAARLDSPKGLKGATYSTLFGLLAATGLRISEAVALDRERVDLQEGILHVHRTKFGKSRLVPVHESTCRVLADYAARRDRVVRGTSSAFFVSEQGGRLTQWAARYNFAKVSQEIGLRAPVPGHRHGHGPRLHDFRHRFAAHTLLNWYRTGRNVERELPKLATYLGHVHVNDTYWYIEALPELLQLAIDRLFEDGKEGPS